MSEVLASAPSGIDVRQGSIFYDAVAGVCFKIAQYYADLATSFDLVFLTTAVDEYLDMKGAESGVYRNPATSARYAYVFEGSRPSAGERFFAEGKYFRLGVTNGVLFLEAEIAGIDSNDILSGTAAVPVNNIGGLVSSAFGELIEPGVDTEGDEDYRQRIREKVAGPAENGNRQHYKTWCEDVVGVGRARIIPLFAGDNTVLGVIIGADGTPAAAPVVERVQEYVDPITLGDEAEYKGQLIPIGDGLGDGAANIGAHFAAIAAEAFSITVAFTAVLSSGASAEQTGKEAAEVIREHFKELALTTPDNEIIVVRISTIGALLYALPSIIDYSDLTFNGETTNIELDDTEVPVLEEVSVSAIIR